MTFSLDSLAEFHRSLVRIQSDNPSLGLHMEENYSMRTKSYFQTGGRVAGFIVLDGLAQVEEVVPLLIKHGLDYELVGRGTNVIVKEGFIPKVMLQLNFNNWFREKEGEKNYRVVNDLLELPASMPLVRANKIAHDCGLSGLEFFVGIPGGVGGAVVMNAGVKGVDVAGVLSRVKIFNGKQVVERTKEELNLSYRHSNIAKKAIVLTATFKLKAVGKEEVQRLKKQCLNDLALRKKNQPYSDSSVGSTFVNPLPYFAGALIEECGLKGKRMGGVSVSTKHANFIINDGVGTSDEAVALIETIKSTVKQVKGIDLVEEVRYLGY